jgi:hypothetical protein
MTVGAGGVLVIHKSASVDNAVAIVWVLLVKSGSPVEAVTSAVLMMLEPTASGLTVPWIVIVAVAPGVAAGINPKSQVTSCPLRLHDPRSMSTLWMITLEGTSSVTTTSVASEGPALATFMV